MYEWMEDAVAAAKNDPEARMRGFTIYSMGRFEYDYTFPGHIIPENGQIVAKGQYCGKWIIKRYDEE